MGSLIAPLLADVCMNWMFDQARPSLDQNTVLIRYVDIFCDRPVGREVTCSSLEQ